MYILRLFTLLIICMNGISLNTAETIAEGESIIIYDDGLLANLAKSVGKDKKSHFKKYKIKWSVKSLKQGTFATALESIEKHVLKKKPDIVALSFGLYDIYNPRKKELLTSNLDNIEEHITKLVTLIHAAKARVVLISPGLCTENIDSEEMAAATALTQRIMAVAKRLELTACDLHTPVVNWLKMNPSKKKGRTQLSKDGIKWNAAGVELISSPFLRAFGMGGGNGINRPIKWDERIVIHTPAPLWVLSFGGGLRMTNRLTSILKKAGPAEAPVDFNTPGVNGPNCVYANYIDYPTDYDTSALSKYKPSVAFVYPFYEYATRGSVTDTSKLETYLDNMMRSYSQLPFPVYIMTHLWGVEDGEQALRKGPRYERCKHISELINTYAGKYNVEVIDLFALCEQVHANNKIVVFGKEHKATSTGNIVPSLAGKQLMLNEMKRIMGLLDEKPIKE